MIGESINYGYLTVPAVVGVVLSKMYANVFDEIRRGELHEYFTSEDRLPFEFVELPTNSSFGVIQSILSDIDTPYHFEYSFAEDYSEYAIRGLSRSSEAKIVTFTSNMHLMDLRNVSILDFLPMLEKYHANLEQHKLNLHVLYKYAPKIAQCKLIGDISPLEVRF